MPDGGDDGCPAVVLFLEHGAECLRRAGDRQHVLGLELLDHGGLARAWRRPPCKSCRGLPRWFRPAPIRPTQASASTPAMPASPSVGRSGNSGERCGEVTASSLSLPSAASGATDAAGSTAICTSPRSSAVTAAGDPWKGRCTTVGAGLHRQRRHGEMRQRAPTDRAVGELVRLALDRGEQARDAVGRNIGGDCQHARLRGEDRDRRDVLGRVVGHLGEQQVVDHQRPDDAHPQRVAVGRGLGRRRRAGVAAGARAVLDHERLAEPLLQALGDDAREAVGRRAGDERHDDGDLPRRASPGPRAGCTTAGWPAGRRCSEALSPPEPAQCAALIAPYAAQALDHRHGRGGRAHLALVDEVDEHVARRGLRLGLGIDERQVLRARRPWPTAARARPRRPSAFGG